MNGYVCFYRGKRVPIKAETTYKAQCEVARILNVPDKKRYLISVTLAELPDGTQVSHVPTF